MSRIPKLKRWRCTHTWTGAQIEVDAPTRVLAKMNAAHALGIPLLWYGEFSATLLKGVAPVLKLS